MVITSDLPAVIAPATHGCTPATLFQAASISKPIAALAALALVRDGVSKLDDLVNTKLAGPWNLVSRSIARGAPTLRELLNHTAGVNVRAYPGYPHGATPPAIRDILIGGPAINTAPTLLVATAGAGEMYSGGGYTVLQCLLEDVTKRSLPDLVKALVFDPLQMTSAR